MVKIINFVLCVSYHTWARTHSSLEVPTPNLTLAAVGRGGDWGAVQVGGCAGKGGSFTFYSEFLCGLLSLQ